MLAVATARPRFSVYNMKTSVLAIAACINGETSIFGSYYKEALGSRCCMYQRRDCDFRFMFRDRDGDDNGETAIFIYIYI